MKKITFFILFLFAVVSLSAQTTYTVSSPDDDGAGTLRNILSSIASGDIITIPADYVITLQSPLEIGKHVTINGQGSTIKTAEPGVSTYRLFLLGSASGSTIFNIAFNDIKFQGGDVRLNSDVTVTAPNHGGAMLVLKRVNLTLNNCEFTDSKAGRGGAICVWDGQGFSSHIENCKFSGNNAAEYGGAFYFNKSQSPDNVAGESVVINTVFEGNVSALASSVKVNVPASFQHCLFKENLAPQQATTSAGSGTFLVDDNPDSNVRLESCTFIGNNNGGTNPTIKPDGGSAFVANCPTTTFFITNCTFYNNIGARGAIYLRYGKIFMVNCTIAGNMGYCSSVNLASGGFSGGTRTDGLTIEATLVNNIFAYNYVNSSQLANGTETRDMFVPDTYVKINSDKNIIGAAHYSASAKFTNTNPVAFFYDPPYDDPLFAAYTTTTLARPGTTDTLVNVPVYDPETWTVALAVDGYATGTAYSKAMVIDPEIEALIPEKDQRGFIRSTTTPSLGSYEYNGLSAIKEVVATANTFIAGNTVSDYLILKNNLNINRMSVLNIAGKVIYSVTKPEAIISIKVAAGLYLVRFETVTGVTTEKLMVK